MKVGTHIFLQFGDEQVPAEVALWRAVIAQALFDATLGNLRLLDGAEAVMPASPRQEMLIEVEKARRWLQDDSRDFREVCSMASVVPDRVRRAAVAAIAEFDRAHDWRAARGGMWA